MLAARGLKENRELSSPFEALVPGFFVTEPQARNKTRSIRLFARMPEGLLVSRMLAKRN